jgi:hypothetical protein
VLKRRMLLCVAVWRCVLPLRHVQICGASSCVGYEPMQREYCLAIVLPLTFIRICHVVILQDGISRKKTAASP